MTAVVHCPECGTVWPVPCQRDQQHSQCPGCRAVYRFEMIKIQRGEVVPVMRKSRYVPAGQ